MTTKDKNSYIQIRPYLILQVQTPGD